MNEEWDEEQAIIDTHEEWVKETELNREYQDLQTVKNWLKKKIEISTGDDCLFAKAFRKECDRRQDVIRKLLSE